MLFRTRTESDQKPNTHTNRQRGVWKITGTTNVLHFKNTAAKARAAVAGATPQDVVVPLKLDTFVMEPRPPRPPRAPISIVLGFRRTSLEFADLVITLAQVCPKGFCNPRKGKGGFPTLVESAAVQAGMTGLDQSSKPSSSIVTDRESPAEIPDKYLHSNARRRRTAEREAASRTEVEAWA